MFIIRCRAYCTDSVLGGKGIAVQIRGNGHYRNSRFERVKSECLPVCDT